MHGRSSTPQRVPTARRLTALALAAVAIAAIAGGCVQSHDPRDDGSRVDLGQPRVSVMARDHMRA